MNGRYASTAKNIAYIALMTAILIGGQFALSFVAGIEIVTVLLLCFATYFGVAGGILTALSFSLLRCVIWGFYPTAVVLYLIYYPLFALCFGLIGKIKKERFDNAEAWLCFAVNAALALIIAAGVLCASLNLIKVSALYKSTLNVFLFVIAGICSALLIAFDVLFILTRRGVFKSGKKHGEYVLKLFFVTSIAAVFTIFFTLLDDVITPLLMQMGPEAALAYFFSSFVAMLPQVVCAIATVATLYAPITLALTKACPKPNLN